MIGYNKAREDIAAGRAQAVHLWILVTDEHQRDGYALNPDPWEGPGQYQCVRYDENHVGILVLIPPDKPSLRKQV